MFHFLFNRPFSNSKKESEESGSNDISLHFVEFSNVYNSDRSSDAIQSILSPCYFCEGADNTRSVHAQRRLLQEDIAEKKLVLWKDGNRSIECQICFISIGYLVNLVYKNV